MQIHDRIIRRYFPQFYRVLSGLSVCLLLGSLTAEAQPECWVRQTTTPYNASLVISVLDEQGINISSEVTLAAFRSDGSFSSSGVSVNDPNEIFMNYNGAKISDEASFMIYHNGAVYTASPATLTLRAGEIYGRQEPLTFTYLPEDVLPEAAYCTGSSGSACMGDDLLIEIDHTVSATLRAGNTITSGIKVAEEIEVIYKAGSNIRLTPGFRVMPGGMFRAMIDDCDVDPSPAEASLPDPVKSPAEIGTHTRFEVFPNPSRGLIQLDWVLANETSVRIELYTPSGQLLQEVLPEATMPKGRSLEQVQLPDLPAGVYWLVAHTPSRRITKQLFILQ